MAAADGAFMAAMTDGFVVSAVVLTSAVVIAFTLIPTRMRETQAEFDESGFEPTGDDAPGLEPLPEGGAASGPLPDGTAIGLAVGLPQPTLLGDGGQPVPATVPLRSDHL